MTLVTIDNRYEVTSNLEKACAALIAEYDNPSHPGNAGKQVQREYTLLADIQLKILQFKENKPIAEWTVTEWPIGVKKCPG